LLERQSNLSPRGMIVHDRTRLIDQLNFSNYLSKHSYQEFFQNDFQLNDE